ncbi:MAG: rhodanese domain-containing protein, partial [Candidatus Omnitrophota bacterium]|nr:rhodanese domain-containing protein [Candidatus Omnitrophota bacterium]
KKKGFKKVYQLHGGIINYKQKENGAHYQGKCFVFDDRLAVPVEEPQKEPLARCAITGVPCDTYLNCANPDCNQLFICSQEGAKQMEGCCSAQCLQSPWRKPFNPDNIYEPTRKRYIYESR